MRTQHILIICLILFCALEAIFIAGSLSLVLVTERRAQEESTYQDFDRIEVANEVELASNIMLGHAELLQAQLARIAEREHVELRLKTGSLVQVSGDAGKGEKLTRKIPIDFGETVLGELQLSRPLHSLLSDIRGPVVVFILFQVALMMALAYAVYFWFSSYVILPLEQLSLSAQNGLPVGPNQLVRWMPRELRDIATSLAKVWSDFREQSQQAAQGKIAAQVAHDIRSPLMALNVVMKSNLERLPAQHRSLISSAIQRIQDIANDLVRQHQSEPENKKELSCESRGKHLLALLVTKLVSEKRSEYADLPEVEIIWRPDEAYGVFVAVEPSLFARALSNVINNAVEGLIEGKGHVKITAELTPDFCRILIKDDGVGIPADVLSKLAMWGVTHGKQLGTGIGLHQVRAALESWGGTLSISSKVGKGTTVELKLPRAAPPAWFVPALMLDEQTHLVLLDDDRTVHQTWIQRLHGLGRDTSGITLHSTFSANEFVECMVKLKDEKVFYLCDYELRGQQETGLDLIIRGDLQRNSILVTSHCEEKSILEQCERAGVRLLPKELAPYIPVIVN